MATAVRTLAYNKKSSLKRVGPAMISDTTQGSSPETLKILGILYRAAGTWYNGNTTYRVAGAAVNFANDQSAKRISQGV